MTYPRVFWLGVCVIAVLVIISGSMGSALGNDGMASPQVWPRAIMETSTPQGAATVALGVPAFRPLTGTGTTPDGAIRQVKGYLRSHQGVLAKTLGLDLTSVSVEPMMAMNADGVVGERLGLAPKATVYLVRFKRAFSVSAPPAQSKAPAATRLFKHGFMIFDGQTGNLVLYGGLVR